MYGPMCPILVHSGLGSSAHDSATSSRDHASSSSYSRHQAGWHQRCRRLNRLEADFLRIDTQPLELALVDADGVVVLLRGLVNLVLEILDLPVLGTEDLLQLLRDVGNYGRIQSCIGQDFGELRLLLIELLRECFELLLQDDILPEFCLALDFLHCLLEALVQVISLLLHLPVLVLASPVLLLGLRDLLLELLEVRLQIFQGHLVLGIGFELLLQGSLLFELLLQGPGEVPVLLPEQVHLLLVGLLLFLHLENFVLQRLYQLQVVMGDVIVVGLDLIESLLVIEEKLVDMLILALLDLVDLHLAPEL
mmetsp:Transcript_143683/g.203235  ORF Transcript_143683/g.203235 Transcript_143683/m.203235 type:complete len:307 (+) Transcript_143683:115-1035(+)